MTNEAVYAWQLNAGDTVRINDKILTVVFADAQFETPEKIEIEWSDGSKADYPYLFQFRRIQTANPPAPQTGPNADVDAELAKQGMRRATDGETGWYVTVSGPKVVWATDAPPPVPSADGATDDHELAVIRERLQIGKLLLDDDADADPVAKQLVIDLIYMSNEVYRLAAANDALQAKVEQALGHLNGPFTDARPIRAAEILERNAPPAASAATADAPVMTANNVMPLSEWNNIVAGANSYAETDPQPPEPIVRHVASTLRKRYVRSVDVEQPAAPKRAKAKLTAKANEWPARITVPLRRLVEHGGLSVTYFNAECQVHHKTAKLLVQLQFAYYTVNRDYIEPTDKARAALSALDATSGKAAAE